MDERSSRALRDLVRPTTFILDLCRRTPAGGSGRRTPAAREGLSAVALGQLPELGLALVDRARRPFGAWASAANRCRRVPHHAEPLRACPTRPATPRPGPPHAGAVRVPHLTQSFKCAPRGSALLSPVASCRAISRSAPRAEGPQSVDEVPHHAVAGALERIGPASLLIAIGSFGRERTGRRARFSSAAGGSTVVTRSARLSRLVGTAVAIVAPAVGA